MIKLITLTLVALSLTGCATPNYTEYAQAQVKIAEANALAQKYKYEALVMMGKDASDVARVAAVLTINQQNTQQNTSVLAPPKAAGETALQWASLLVPSLTQMYSINANKELSLANTTASVQNNMITASSYTEFGKLINSPTIVNQPNPVIVPTQIVNPVVVPTQVVNPLVITTK